LGEGLGLGYPGKRVRGLTFFKTGKKKRGFTGGTPGVNVYRGFKTVFNGGYPLFNRGFLTGGVRGFKKKTGVFNPRGKTGGVFYRGLTGVKTGGVTPGVNGGLKKRVKNGVPPGKKNFGFLKRGSPNRF